MEPTHKITPTVSYNIFVGGDAEKAEKICRKYCDKKGFCVTVTPTKYVYTYGEEEGVIVGIINYPRFPKSKEQLREYAVDLAHRLVKYSNQRSVSIQGPDETEWFSWRKENE